MTIEPVYSPFVFGIDLGTCNSAIAVTKSGQTEIIPVEGRLTFPSVVSMKPDGAFLVGQQARNRMLIDPENTVASVKREMGSEWTKEFPNQPGVIYTPVHLSAEILRALTFAAEECKDPDVQGQPRDVVVCVPANLKEHEIKAVGEAASMAGLNVIEFLEEPVAASIAYALDRSADQTILVYDLGGGTFDVSILDIDSTRSGKAALRVKAKRGVPRLGGDDFDRKLMEIVAAELAATSGVDILDLKKEQGIKTRALREAQQKLKEVCERAKCTLTEAETANITVNDIIKDESGKFHNISVDVTREQFEDAIRDLVMLSKDTIELALKDAALSMDDISRIVLVGGSTKVPLVRQMLTEMYGKEPWGDLDPDTVVARGAAIYGARLKGLVPERPVELQTIVTHYLGIETVGNEFSCLIEKGAEIPEDGVYTATEVYTNALDDMTELIVRVIQAEDKVKYAGDKGSACIGEFALTGIPPKPRNSEQITVSFAINRQNLLTVTAKSSTSEGNLEIRRSKARA